MSGYVCIHGHFYQPPRENPWSGRVDRQPSAAPAHDWNQRVTDECYEPNAAARLLDDRGEERRRANNYESISFNFGPTLLSWMERARPETYAAILQADRDSARRFSGHGSALAQVYGHAILPLCNERDRETQVVWGIRDFRHRFGRSPEGMWLPETAVDVASLETLARHGIRFTILAPSQASLTVDSTRPYRCPLPSGRSVDLFFYDGTLSHGIAFGDLLRDGERLADELLIVAGGDHGRLAHVATDGETYGHHHEFGEMALARALAHIDAAKGAALTNYGEYLERHPPAVSTGVVEESSWSCSHGLERWTRDCGCASEYHKGWNQSWRAPLRESLDWLRDVTAPRWERVCAGYLVDPWAARDDSIDLRLDTGAQTQEEFFARHSRRPLDADSREHVLALLELQRCMLLMFTSCGWFFEELSRVETIQILRYAARGMELSRAELGSDPEPEFLDRFGKAQCNAPGRGDGRRLWLDKIRGAR